MGRATFVLLAAAALTGCATSPRVAPPVRNEPPPTTPAHGPTGLEAVMGRTAAGLTALFGTPGLDIREGPARKLQFGGPACVLDAYLYPPARGGDPVVTHVDARLPDGRDTDRAACIGTLSRR